MNWSRIASAPAVAMLGYPHTGVDVGAQHRPGDRRAYVLAATSARLGGLLVGRCWPVATPAPWTCASRWQRVQIHPAQIRHVQLGPVRIWPAR
jgi:hypothetical protein